MERHPFSDASAKAVYRLSAHALEVEPVATLIEKFRVALALDNQSVVAAMIFIQFLVKNVQDIPIRMAVVAAYNFGIKLTTEGFYTSDIIDHVTDEFSVDVLHHVDNFILGEFEFNDMERMQCSFRNALLNVSLDESSVSAPPSGYANSPNGTMSHSLRVVVVDDDALTLEFHRALLASVVSNAEVHCFDSITKANSYVDTCTSAQLTVDLVLLDWNMPSGTPGQNRFAGTRVARQLKHDESVLKPFFSARPLVVLVTAHNVDPSRIDLDGSFASCDCVIQKPLTYNKVCKVVHAACP